MLVVGGGIVGAGVALDAVTRGLRVGLVEAGDWGGGRPGVPAPWCTAVWSTCRRIGVGAVAALRRERDLLLDRTAPHLVRRVPLLVPLTGGPAERLAVGAALSLYDAAAFSIRQPGVLPGPPSARPTRSRPAGARRSPCDRRHRRRPALRGPGRRRSAHAHRGPDRDRVRGPGARPDTGAPAAADDDGRVVGARGDRADDGAAGGPGSRPGRGAGPGTRCRHLLPSCPVLLPGEPAPGPSEGPPSEQPAPAVGPPRAAAPATPRVDRTGAARAVTTPIYVVPWGRHWIVGSDRSLVGARPTPGRSSTPTWPGRSTPTRWRAPSPAPPRWAGRRTYTDGAGAGARPGPGPGKWTGRLSGDAEHAVDAAVGQIGGLHPPSHHPPGAAARGGRLHRPVEPAAPAGPSGRACTSAAGAPAAAVRLRASTS